MLKSFNRIVENEIILTKLKLKKRKVAMTQRIQRKIPNHHDKHSHLSFSSLILKLLINHEEKKSTKSFPKFKF